MHLSLRPLCFISVVFFFQTLLFPYPHPLLSSTSQVSSLGFSFFITQSLSILWVFLPILNRQSCNYSSSSRHPPIPLRPSWTIQFLSCWQQGWCLILLILPVSLKSPAFHFSPSHHLSFIRPSIHPSSATFLLTSTTSPLFQGFQIFHFSPWLKAG